MTLDCEKEHDLQLSRSSSAAAISERTLEECWSTLQRLFMHKSAMQQIQQQIPRVGLGTHGVAGPASLGGSITPGSDTKPHQCQQCMKSFSSNHQLVQHIRVHTGEKPYKCSYCDRRFKQLSHVQQHTRLHTGERPYKCHLPDCGRAFIQLSNLQQHLRNHDAQVERAKNRPFHCNICGKGFATESSLRTHTSKELQLHLGVLQQHAALIGGPNATSCPVCHKLFLGTEALVDHMKHVHKEKSPAPSGAGLSQFSELNQGAAGSGNGNGTGLGNEQISTQCISESNCAQSSHQATAGGSNLIDSYLGKRRTANHPCPVCGKHYVNEGSLRKHLACHAETSQLTNSLRMWPCSVCQAVFTHENGLLTHMESMRMDPKHQFAAQYVLSRAAAEQRERDSLLAVTLAASSGTGGRMGMADAGNALPMGTRNSEGSNSKCPSPSANSECSSNGRLSSSTTSDQDQDIDHGLSENENSNQNNISSSANNNNNCTNNNNSHSNKITELRLPSSGQYSMGTDLHVANRMSLMAAAAAAVAASRPQDGVDSSAVPSAAVQAAVVNLAAAMRMNNPSNGPTAYQQHHGDHTQPHHSHPHPHPHPHPHNHHQQQAPQHQQQQLSHLLVHTHHGSSNSRSQRSPNLNVPSLQNESSAAASIAMNMNVHMMRGSLEPDPGLGGMHPIDVLHQQQQHHHHQTSNYSQHAVAPTSQQAHAHAHPHPQAHHTSHHHPDPETALRMHQAEAILRSHTEAAFRLATGTVPVSGAGTGGGAGGGGGGGAGVKSEAGELQQQLSSHGNCSGTASSNDQQHRFHTHQQEHQLPSSS
ncbi:zinc finger protein 592 isoform X2 [Drosophila elegans]|uniref:zinc finger protein 592 isoform X2 n=1 Tax=Drosophila elegans TaxID=30023 RepID=UPI0007E5E4EF|nr:zinc finger protein 592 isoform X2 [Drosophila elegans]